MKILLVILLAMAVSCATTGTKNPLGVEVLGTAKISESNAAIAMELAFRDAMQKIVVAKCKVYRIISVCIFPNQDKVEVVLYGKDCNPPRRVENMVVPKEKDSR